MGISEGSPFQIKGIAYANVLRQEQDWQVQKTARRPVWLEQSEQNLEGLEMIEPRSGPEQGGPWRTFCLLLWNREPPEGLRLTDDSI